MAAVHLNPNCNETDAGGTELGSEVCGFHIRTYVYNNHDEIECTRSPGMGDII